VRPALFNHFGEQVAFEPTGTPRLVTALVERNPPVIYDEGGSAYMTDWVIRVADDDVLGISVDDITRGVTQVSILEEAAGSTYRLKTIVQIESRANGILQLRTR
jgi:hypothetical protein